MEDFARAIADFVRDHQAWAAPLVLLLAFGESLAFISLLIPAWGALVAIGALIGVSGISFWPVWIAGGIGAALGDWVSYWFGFRYKEQVAQIFEMPYWRFQFANFVSALVWAAALLLFGDVIAYVLEWLWRVV